MMYAKADYAQPLRAIGQALETLNVQAFEMEPAGEAYFIRGAKFLATPDIADQRLTVDNLRSIWGMVAERKDSVVGSGQRAKNPTATSKIELNYTPKDVERLELEGRAKRGASENMADPTSLSQLLRCIGAYLTQKVARLQKLSWEGDSLFVEYETSLGSRIQETLAASDLYDLGVRMYLQRASRATH
jgi:hypothetical protein